MKRAKSNLAGLIVLLVLLSAVWTVPTARAQDGGEEEEHGDRSNAPVVIDAYAPERGAAVYAEFCQACHGPQGESLGEGPPFAAIEYGPDVREVIEKGIDSDPDDGVAMPAYAQVEGGILSDEQITFLIAYMETWAHEDEVPSLPAPKIEVHVERVPGYFGDPQSGAEIYATSCVGCHGMEGKGRVPPNFPPLVVPEDVSALTMVFVQGSESPYMPAFAASAGGPLSEEELQDLETYIASWRLEEPDEPASPEGYSTLLMILGIGAILLVGGAYLSR